MSPKTSSFFCAGLLVVSPGCCVVVVVEVVVLEAEKPPQIESVSKRFDCDCVVVFQILGWAGTTGTGAVHPDEAPHMLVPVVPIIPVAATGCC